MVRTKGEQKAYLDGYEMCAECIKNYLTDEGKQKLECYLMVVRNAVGTENLEQEPILNKIRAEIDKLPDLNPDYEMDKTIHVSKWAVFDIIDKYRKE